MASGVKINWSKYDAVIKQHLPNMTVPEFTQQYLPDISVSAVRVRAKKIGIQPAIKKMSVAQKAQISARFAKIVSELDKQFVIDNLNKLSRKDIAKHIGVSMHTINKIIKDLGLTIDYKKQKEIHAVKSSAHVHLAIEASAKMWDDPAFRQKRSQEISKKNKELWQDEKYRIKISNGISAAYQNTDLKSRLSVINKKRYADDESVRDVLHSARPWKTSKLNKTIAQVLEAHAIEFEEEFRLVNHLFDFKIGNILLEVQGNYWHKLPASIANDKSKATMVREYFPHFDLRTIWESEFKSIRGKDRLLEIIGFKQPNPTIISLQELAFETYNNKISAEKFINAYHYLGWANRSSHMYRLHYLGQTVMLAVFGPPVRPNIASGRVLELVRLCRHPYFYNKNMGSYFLSQCEKSIRALSIFDNLVSFSDDRLHNGVIYAASNWQCHGKTQSDYQYLSHDNVPMHKKTLYNRARKNNMTERVYAELHGFKKTSVGTKTKWISPLT